MLDDRTRICFDHMKAMYNTLHLPKNVKKGGWNKIDQLVLMQLAEMELGELKGALWNFYHNPTQDNFERVQSEAADVSNFAAMIVDNCRVKL